MISLYQPGAVTAFNGTLGSGKTSFALYLALRGAHYLPVYTNFDTAACVRLENYIQLFRIKEGLIVLDEAQQLIDSRNFGLKSQILMTWWLQVIRKRKIALFFTTQDISQVDLRLRILTDIVFFCVKTPTPYRRVWCYAYALAGMRELSRNLFDTRAMWYRYATEDERIILSPFRDGRAEKALPDDEEELEALILSLLDTRRRAPAAKDARAPSVPAALPDDGRWTKVPKLI